LVKDWKDTPGIEEENMFKTLKEKAKNEAITEEIGARKKKEMEENRRKRSNPEESILLEPQKVLYTVPETKTLAVLQTADLGCDDPIEPSRARDYGIVRNITITKPQLMYSGDAAEATTCPVTSPAHQ
jgi:hypothetical protein